MLIIEREEFRGKLREVAATGRDWVKQQKHSG